MRAKQIASAIKSAKTEVKRTMERQRAASAALMSTQYIVTHIASMVLHFLADVQSKTPAQFWLSAYGGDEVTLTFYVTGVQSFKDPAIIKTCSFLEGIFDESATDDHASARNRDIRFRKGLGALRVNLALYADEESASCRRIEIGRKTVEQVEYKLVCEE